jgi:cob(I)alamin adenosyltransferase
VSAITHGLLIVFTGNGKGKTTAALGLLMRASGHQMKAKMLQFIKAGAEGIGEYQAAKQMGFEILPLGAGFVREPDRAHSHANLARETWKLALRELTSASTDILILDEITYALQFRWISLDEVLEAVASRPASMHVVFTGRDAPAGLIDVADLVTEMREIKHPFRVGVPGQAGIEF